MTVKGDHNDMDAVLKAAIISEKRRSRAVSMSSMTSLNDMKFRSGSYTSETRFPSHERGEIEPIPSYNEVVGTGHIQTNL